MTALRFHPDDGGTLDLLHGEEVVFAPSRLCLLVVDGVPRDRIEVDAIEDRQAGEDRGATEVTGRVEGTSLAIRWTATRLAAGDVWQLGLSLRNDGADDVRVARMDPLAVRLVEGVGWSSLHFRSAWGDEFTPVAGTIEAGLHLECRSGRSSHGFSPWLGLERRGPNAAGANLAGTGLIVSPAWSGNWHIDVAEDGLLSAGISPREFFVDLAPGDEVTAPSVVLALGTDREDAAVALSTAVGEALIPRSAASEALPVEWNHWWPYEDAEVTEEIIWANAQIAAELGVGVCTVDAGWFGDSDAGSDWQVQRGDWHRTNTVRFPSGLGALGDGIRAHGPKAGIWIEAEAVGSAADLRRHRADILAYGPEGWARDDAYRAMTVSMDDADPSFLGYVCMGSPGGREHVAASMAAVVRETGAEWVKLDFNIDPDSGCTRTDHGHGAGDGLLRHYEGLYAVLDTFRAEHPKVILESCSSGGLRQDLGLARHVHCFFLSDPDYTDHHLQVVWGTSLMLPPAAMLHWSWSQWRGDYPDSQLDFGSLSRNRFDTMLRAAMIHRFGYSLRLPELSADQRDSLRVHTTMFTDVIAPFVRSGVLRRLTDQPLKRGGGHRSPAFQLDLEDRSLLAVFRLDGATGGTVVRPRGLDDARAYSLTDLATGRRTRLERGAASAGIELRGAEDGPEGDTVAGDAAEGVSSWLLILEPID